MHPGLMTGAGSAAVIAATAVMADLRRVRRADPDRVGFMPWRGIQAAAAVLTLVLLVLARG